MKKSILILLPLIILLSCCKDDMPEPDKCENCPTLIFRCKIDGVDYKPYFESNILWGCSPIDCQYYKDTKSLSLRTSNVKTKWSITLRRTGIIIGENVLSKNTRVSSLNNSSDCVFHNLDINELSTLKILNIDTINFQIKGEFEFDAINNCGDTLQIREGYFDVQYRF